MASNSEIAKRFEHHSPKSASREATHMSIKRITGDAALALNVMLPESREKSLALTALQEAMLWADAAVTIHGATPEGS